MNTSTDPKRNRHSQADSRVSRRIIAFAVGVALLVPGCTLFHAGVWSDPARWGGLTGETAAGSKKQDGKNGGPENSLIHNRTSILTHQSRDTISLAIEFRHVPSSALGKSMWLSIDETAFDARVRQAWLANGLRIGLLNSWENAPVGDAAADGRMKDPVNELFAGAEILGAQTDGRETIPLRPSRRHELPLAPTLEGSHTVLIQQTGGLTGLGLSDPQFLLALTAEEGSRNGQTILHIRPEIQHGSIRQKFVSSDTAVRIQTGRQRWELTDLDFAWTARPGAVLVIAPVMQPDESEPTFGLGRQMMRDPDHVVDDQHIVAFLQIKQ